MPDLPDWSVNLGWINEVLAADLPLAAGAHHDLSIGQYASILVVANDASGTHPNLVIKAEIHQAGTVNGQFDTVPYTEYLTAANATADTTEWILPVRGGSIRLTNTTAGTINLIVYGSNRTLDDIKVVGEQAAVRQLIVTGAVVGGVTTPLVSNDGAPATTCVNGPIVAVVTAGFPAGTLRMLYTAPDATQNEVTVLTTAATPTLISLYHPKARVLWGFRPNVGAGVSGWLLTVIPGQQ